MRIRVQFTWVDKESGARCNSSVVWAEEFKEKMGLDPMIKALEVMAEKRQIPRECVVSIGLSYTS